MRRSRWKEKKLANDYINALLRTALIISIINKASLCIMSDISRKTLIMCHRVIIICRQSVYRSALPTNLIDEGVDAGMGTVLK
jgi:hypothetical protein